MALVPDPPFPKSRGHSIRSKDWNDAISEVIRLDEAKANRAGDVFTGPLIINDGSLTINNGAVPQLRISASLASLPAHLALQSAGNEYGLSVSAAGSATPGILSLTVNGAGSMAVHPNGRIGFGIGSAAPNRVVEFAGSEIHVGGPGGGYSFANRQATAFLEGPASGERWVLYASEGAARLWSGEDRLILSPSGGLTLTGELALPRTVGGVARFTNTTFSNEASFRNNNLKLVMGSTGFFFPGNPPPVWEFAIGTSSLAFGGPGGFTTNFFPVLSVNNDGTVTVSGTASVQNLQIRSGAKPGFVVDHFVNLSGEALERGDVVIVAAAPRHFWATGNAIPIPEVDRTDIAYDRRVCGIVAQVVTDEALPFAEQPDGAAPPDVGATAPAHPLAALAAAVGDDLNRDSVGPRQLGTMVTLGAYAVCKVDADIAPIEIGDLLTTSPTRGHAQKVLAREQGVGAIIAKALAPLSRGRGTIPVLVTLQ